MENSLENRFVAHFDMLGMKALTKRDPELAWQKLSALTKARQERLSIGIERLDTREYIQDQVRAFTFSDTIVLFSKSDTQNDAMAITIIATELFVRSLQYCVPLRGGIARGQFAFNLGLNLFSGPALVDAYELGESSQWLGISFDAAAAEAVLALPIARSMRGRSMVVDWEVLCKGGRRENRKVINWPESNRNNYIGPIPVSAEIFYRPFSEIFGTFGELREADRLKYENTVAFLNEYFEPE
jgi:hypothetical protein